jgi:exodeoxyribonuclease VII small subunit
MKDKDKDKDLNFEKALADLEGVVDKLEKGGLSLNESLGLFEKGVTLARYLRGELDKAEKKIEILLKDEKGGVKAAAFGLDEAEGKGGGEDSGEADDADDDDDDDDKDDGEEAEKEAKAKKKPKSRPKKEDDGSALPF